MTLKITETPKIFSPTTVERAEHEGCVHFGIQELKIQALFVVSRSSVVLRFFFQDSDTNYTSEIWKLHVCKSHVVSGPPVVRAVFGQENVRNSVLLAWLW